MRNILTKIIEIVKKYESDLVLMIGISCITIISFNMGRSVSPKQAKLPISISQPSHEQVLNTGGREVGKNPARDLINTAVIASKNSKSKLFHYPWCPGYSKIAEKNKLTFANASTAIAAGFTQASNCK